MKLGLLFTGGLPIADLLSLGRKAETTGFSSIYMAEVYRSAWVALTALAGATHRVTLGTYVLNAYARSPLLTGMTAIDFNELCGGRLLLGIGGGNRIINEEWQGIAHARVLTKMREYVEIMQQMACAQAGKPIEYAGKVHHMRWTPVVGSAAERFPVYLAAVFPAMLQIAATIADGIAGGATLSSRYLRDYVLPTATEFAIQAGRDPTGLRIKTVMFTAVSPDRAHARQAARAALCSLFAPLPHPYYEYTMREQGYSSVVDKLRQLSTAGDPSAAHAAIPEAMLDELTIAGTPSECRAQIQRYTGLVEELILINAMPAPEGDWHRAYADFLALPDKPA